MIKNKRNKDSGFTIIELLVVFLIVSFAIIALFTGIGFAENQIFKNYRTRKAILLASARLEYHYLYYKQRGEFLLEPDAIPLYGGSYQFDSISSGRDIEISFDTNYQRTYDYQMMSNSYIKTRIVVEGSWREPSRKNKQQKIILIEDYYDSTQ